MVSAFCLNILEKNCDFYPVAASMVYQRNSDVAHRVVTCLGCGWCTFVLRAQDAVAPPVSLASHMSRCTGRGARISIPSLPPSARRPTRALVARLLAASNSASSAFAARFPGVRGYIASTRISGLGNSDSFDSEVNRRRLKYESPLSKVSPVVVKSATVKVEQSQIEEVREDLKSDPINGVVSPPLLLIRILNI